LICVLLLLINLTGKDLIYEGIETLMLNTSCLSTSFKKPEKT